jgi:pyridoxal phosphate enzyme (YggS family)
MSATPERVAELETNLATVRERVDAACAAAGRQPDEVTLVVVTKYFPRSDVDALAALGVTDIGENKAQEASAKLAEEGGAPEGVRTHFIGQLQSNKAGEVARWADVVHSVDRVKIVRALDRGAQASGRSITGLIQVDLDGSDPGRGGALPADVPALADAVAESGLTLGGLMAVAPRGEDPGAAFARLAEVAERLRAEHPDATMLSAGMSGDLEQAVAHGATHLRVGTAILGSRPSHR